MTKSVLCDEYDIDEIERKLYGYNSFNPEKFSTTQKISDKSPCKGCVEKKDCGSCAEMLFWHLACIAKLKYYEEHDKRIKEK